MIPTVSGPVEASAVTGAFCSAHEHLIKQPCTQAELTNAQQKPVLLSNLAHIRSIPQGEHPSDGLFSVDEAVQELRQLADEGGAGGMVLDCTSVQEGRFPAGLVEVDRRTSLHVVMAASWRQADTLAESTTRLSSETIGREFEQQLVLGEHLRSHSRISAKPIAISRVQAGFMVVRLEDHRYSQNTISSMSPQPENSSDDTWSLSWCVLDGAVSALRKTGAPIVIIFPAFERNHHLVTTAVTSALGSEGLTGKVILTGMCGGVSRPIDDQVTLLRQGFVLCFDNFGRVEWSTGAEYYPSDEESAVRVAELVKMGFAKQILISQGVSRRIHLSRCGGFGYGHAICTVPPRLRRLGVSNEDIMNITTKNALRLLDWYIPPAPPEIPKHYLPCSWCKHRFEPIEGEYYHKFHFVYCGIKCLRAHRDAGFKEIGTGA